MKKIFACLFAIVWSVVALAQSPEEILTRMAEVWEKHEPEGLSITVETKIPIMGTVIMKESSLGKKTRSEFKMGKDHAIVWDDSVTEWTYSAKSKSITIKDSPVAASADSSEGGDVELFTSVTDGYDISIKEETADSWLLLCQKSKSNHEKNDPKTVEITVAKNSFYPVNLKTKMSGITLFMHDITFGLSEASVTFNLAHYPDCKIEDKRGEK